MSSKKHSSSKKHEIDEIDLTNMGNMVDSFHQINVSQSSLVQKIKKNVLYQGYLPSLGSPFLICNWKDSAKITC
jgi:hypothetical protein